MKRIVLTGGTQEDNDKLIEAGATDVNNSITDENDLYGGDLNSDVVQDYITETDNKITNVEMNEDIIDGGDITGIPDTTQDKQETLMDVLNKQPEGRTLGGDLKNLFGGDNTTSSSDNTTSSSDNKTSSSDNTTSSSDNTTSSSDNTTSSSDNTTSSSDNKTSSSDNTTSSKEEGGEDTDGEDTDGEDTDEEDEEDTDEEEDIDEEEDTDEEEDSMEYISEDRETKLERKELEETKKDIEKVINSAKLNVWDVIDTYFRDNSYYKSQHQLDSYNEFIYSEENGIKYIIKRGNPIKIYKEPLNIDKTKFKYEINIHFGEELDSKGEIVPETENIFITSPVIYDSSNNSSYMYPNDARLRGLTYACNVFANIGISYKTNEEDNIIYMEKEKNYVEIILKSKSLFIREGIENKSENRKEETYGSVSEAMEKYKKTIIDKKKEGFSDIIIRNFEKVNLGSIPIMVHSKLCILRNLDITKLSEFGECPYDQGGYFIINGKEKVILSQEKKVNNILYINKSSENNVIIQAIIKSISKEGFQSSRTNAISYMKKKINLGSFPPVYKEVNTILVRILGIDVRVPLFILFRALGFETDKQILDLIIYDSDTYELKNKLLELLRDTIKDSEPIYSQKSAIKFLALNTKQKEVINVLEILNNNFLPNYLRDMNHKGQFLAYSVRKLLLTHIGVINETDRDSYTFKRIDLPGSLLLELFRELWGSFLKNMSLKIDSNYKFNFEKYGKNIYNIINDSNLETVFSSAIINNIHKSFGSIFGTGISGRQGIVQDLNRNSMLGTLSHIRRLSNPIPSGSKTLGPRKLHNSQWGFVCPTESPDGGNVGIINHLTIISSVSFSISSKGIYEALIDNDMILLDNIIYNDLYEYCKIFLNGKWIGCHTNPKFLYKLFKLLKLNSIINIYTSISWDVNLNEIYIFTDEGRIVRPIFVFKKNEKGNNVNELINGNYDLLKYWKNTIHGYMYQIDENISVYNSEYFKDVLDNIKEENEDYMRFLENMSSPIEYIDSIESEYTFISKDIYNINNKHTHCEIHSSLILSPLALQVPFPEHSQYPRNVFSCQQTKQAVGVYSTSFNTRFDTFAHILNYPQKPIVATKYKKYINNDKLPNGINCIVAIASYTGYNQEDSLILNKNSIDRGMFKSIYYRSYEDDEETEDNSVSSFGNPNTINVLKEEILNYSKIDENGIIREGEYVTPEDMLTCKIKTEKLNNGREVNNLSGIRINHGTSGFVDKVIITKNRNNLRKCKIRIFKTKIPEVGDKYASRCGQKGMCGLLLEQHEMPFTKDGIVPDIIINPHAIPTRMTINQLLEVILGKSCCLGGYNGDSTPFQNTDISDYSDLLSQYNYEKYGNEIMYSGINGEQMKTSIFIGPTYYQRLKIMVADKMFSRSTGPLQHLTNQPAAGRANKGGLRIGEMERDSIISHGSANFLQESMLKRSDDYNVFINEKTGFIDDLNNPENNICSVRMPYNMKLFIQELNTMSISPKLITPTNISNHNLFNYLYENMNSNNGVDDDYNLDDIIDEELENDEFDLF